METIDQAQRARQIEAGERLLSSKAFWALSPAERRLKIQEADPRFSLWKDTARLDAWLENQRRGRFSGQGPLAAPMAPPGAQVQQLPSAGRYLLGGVKGVAKGLVQDWPDWLGLLASSFIGGGPIVGALGRIAGGSAVSAGGHYARQRDVGQAITKGLQFGGLQAVGELVGGVARGVGTHRASKAAFQAHEAAVAQREGAVQAAKDAYETAVAQRAGNVAALKQQYDQAVAQRQDLVFQGREAFKQAQHSRVRDIERQKQQRTVTELAKSEVHSEEIADILKSQVSAWTRFPSNAAGLWRMAHGVDGREALHKAFEAGFANSVPPVGARVVQILETDAKHLKLRMTPVGGPATGLPVVEVDAREAIEAVLGKWLKQPALYSRVIGELDVAGVGDPGLRAMYRSGMSWIAFARKYPILEGKTLHLDRVQRALTRPAGEELARRQAGPLQGALERATPTPPGQVPPAVAPPPGVPPVTRPQMPPLVRRPVPPPPIPATPARKKEIELGGMIGHAAGGVLGATAMPSHPWYGGFLGAGMGTTVGHVLGGRESVYTGVPPAWGPVGLRAARFGPTAGHAAVRVTWDFIQGVESEPEPRP